VRLSGTVRPTGTARSKTCMVGGRAKHAGLKACAPSQTRIALRVEERHWRQLDLQRLRQAVKHAQIRAGRQGELTILLTTDERLCALNARHRGIPRPTNVLAFPAGGNAAGYLGDIAIAYGVAVAEALASGKLLNDHAVHLVVHGVLHLLGYDHGTAREARRMEELEADILHGIGIADPYGRAMGAE
jgi:probable rRNA maturation factor